jgi:hypothetical protein
VSFAVRLFPFLCVLCVLGGEAFNSREGVRASGREVELGAFRPYATQ